MSTFTGAGKVVLAQANSLNIPLPDGVVHCVVTSPPYLGLRAYSGIEPTEWPTIQYAPMPGLAPVTVPGCEAGCEHVWISAKSIKQSTPTAMAGRFGDGDGHDRLERPSNVITIDEGGSWCQRCGGWRGCLGLEPTPEMFVAHLVAVFREVRRVMRDDAVCWLNLGDSYAGGGGYYPDAPSNRAGSLQAGSNRNGRRNIKGQNRDIPGLKPKDLIGIPWRVAFALQADGWWLRSDVVWAKGLSFCPEYSGSAMPESVNGWRWERHRIKVVGGDRAHNPYQEGSGLKQGPGLAARAQREAYFAQGDGKPKYTDCLGCPKCDPNDGHVLRRWSWRPTKAHEMIFMLAKSARYFCDREAVKEPLACPDAADGTRIFGGVNKHGANAKQQRTTGGVYDSTPTGRNPRTVWVLPTSQYPGSHYAVFCRELPEVCIKASTSEAGVCGACGAQWARVVKPTADYAQHLGKDWADDKKDQAEGRGHFQMPDGTYSNQRRIKRNAPSLTASYETHGFRPTCTCNAEPVPPLVLDPFAGSGTTLEVARALGCDGVGLDLSGEYLRDQARVRLQLDAMAAWEDGEAIDGEGEPLEGLPLFQT